MFPSDSITYTFELNGPMTVNFSNNNGPNTILSVAMQQSNVSSDTIVECDNDLVAKNYATNFSSVVMNKKCDNDIFVSKTGNDSATVIITYIPYHQNDFYFGSTSQQNVYNPNTEISTSSDITIYGSFSAGEILIAFLLLCMIVLSLIKGIAGALSHIKTKKTYLSYSGGDVEVRDDL